MLKIESTGKNLEQAIENGLAELKVTRNDVEIKIIEKGGLFKKAKVLLIVDEDVELEMQSRAKKIKELEDKFENDEIANADGDFENVTDDAIGEDENASDVLLEISEDVKNRVSVEAQAEIIPDDEDDEEQELSEIAGQVVSFIKSICAIQNIIVKAKVKENKDDIEINLQGERVGDVIGFRGEGLNSLQYLANIYASKLNKNCPRIYLNVGNYKEERQQSLIKLARRLASKVVKTKQSIKLEPMNAYERKIVHSALQNDSYVTTFSVGEEPKRCLVIDLKKK